MSHPVLEQSEIRKNPSLILIIAGLLGVFGTMGAILPPLVNKVPVTLQTIALGVFCPVLAYKCFGEVWKRFRNRKRRQQG